MTDRPFGPKLMAGNSLKISVWTGIFNNYITINPIPQRINRLPSLPRRGIPTIAVGVNPRSGCEANPRIEITGTEFSAPKGPAVVFGNRFGISSVSWRLALNTHLITKPWCIPKYSLPDQDQLYIFTVISGSEPANIDAVA